MTAASLHNGKQRLYRITKLIASLVILTFLVAYWLMGRVLLGSTAIVEPASQPAQFDFSHAQKILHNTIQTDTTGNIGEKTLILTAEDISAAANFALARKQMTGFTICEITGNRLLLRASILLPDRSAKSYLNIQLMVGDGEPIAQIQSLKIGLLDLPYPLGGWVVQGLLHVPPLSRYGQVVNQIIRDIHIKDDRLIVTMNWSRDLLSQIRGSVIDLADKKRLRIYHDKLAEQLKDGTQNRYVRLGNLMQPLFELAKQRSAGNQDPVAENRALIVVLSAYANGKDLSAALSTTTTPIRRGVLLNKRIDTAKHFLGAAVLAMSGQGTLVEMIGLAKELHDTHDGSGFSFIDLAADEAGAAFGKFAVRSSEKARRIQTVLSQSADESQFIPTLKDLPESMDSEQFAARFKDIRSPEFAELKKQIGARINGLPIYQSM